MCRMLIAVGDVNLSWLIDDFVTMANDENERHENNEDKSFKHGHGWGIVYLNEGQVKIHKTTKPCYEDRQINSFKTIESPLYILHARRGSPGKGGVETVNVHPFQHENYVFCHNGTVNEQLQYDKKFVPNGETDSEELFYYLLSDLNGGIDEKIIHNKLNKIKHFSGMNSILSNGDDNFIITWYTKKPKYYTFKILKNERFVIISSEILPHYKNRNWQKTNNGDIIKLNTWTQRLQYCLEYKL